MQAMRKLPENYREFYTVDLQKDKRLAVIINVFSLLIMVALIIPAHFYIPVTTLFDMEKGLLAYTARFAVMMVSIVVYMVLHELVHGITMKLFGTQKVKYGFTGLYAFAGSDDYYDKASYIIIALAPVIVWGIVIAVINALVPREWFWVVYFIQVCNLSGASGDFYVSVKFLKFPKTILVKDSGVSMTVFAEDE